jgi:prepilin-type N-terminal cleavage/methylation domain-containing protein/prepilin-type processing-associated H-X9-DG protein
VCYEKRFTLIELLVVVAIIGILSAILLPSMAKAREKAKQAVCISQLKQTGTLITLSITDQNGYYHSPQSTGTGTYYNPLWSNWLKIRYGDMNESLFLCPSRENANYYSGWGSYASRTSNNGTAKFTDSHGGDINFNLLESSDWLVGDGRNQSDDRWHRMATDNTSWKCQPWLLHLERGDMLFVGGHVRSLSKGDYNKLGFSLGWKMNKAAVSF